MDTNRGYSFFVKGFDDIMINPASDNVPTYVDARSREDREADVDGGFGAFLKRHGRNLDDRPWIDAKDLGVEKLIEQILGSAVIEKVFVSFPNVDLSVLRPLVERGVSIGFVDVREYDDVHLDAITSLGIRNIEFPDAKSYFSPSFCDGLAAIELETVRITNIFLIPLLNCIKLIVDEEEDIQAKDFVQDIVQPWLNGGRYSRLKYMTFRCSSILGDWSPLEPMPYVPRADDPSYIFVFGITDKKGEHFMEVQQFIASLAMHAEVFIR